jgi:hypothetical protein
MTRATGGKEGAMTQGIMGFLIIHRCLTQMM